MIFNRTQNDVDSAVYLRNTKVKTFQPLTDAEIETLERGTITINTLNRIESKQSELKNLFNDLGYWNVIVSTRSWANTDIFDIKNFQRIIENLSSLRKAFWVYSDTPETPYVSYHYKNINALEKILFDLDNMIGDIKANYKICGTFECGEE